MASSAALTRESLQNAAPLIVLEQLTEVLPELKERGKTAIVISHDDRYYHVADRIVKLDSGTLVHDSFLVADESLIA